MKTNELTGHALNWAVAEADVVKVTVIEGQIVWPEDYEPSTNWAQGGPIIERWMIDCDTYRYGWRAARHVSTTPTYGYGPTPLIAAMRCYVASKLGDEVDIPKELTP
jgi:hypothetical protein